MTSEARLNQVGVAEAMPTVNRRAVLTTLGGVVLAAAGTIGFLVSNAQDRSKSSFDQFKPSISKASVQKQAKSDINFVIEGIEKDRGKPLTKREAEKLQQFYLDQTMRTVQRYYRFTE